MTTGKDLPGAAKPDLAAAPVVSAASKDRRRPGRLHQASPHLIPLLRTSEIGAAAASDMENELLFEDMLAPAKGIATGLLLMVATMSIEPIITVYVGTIVPDPARVTSVSGLVMSASALGSILSASRLGRLADRVGHWTVIVACLLASAALLIPQAFVTAGWQLVGLRFLMGPGRCWAASWAGTSGCAPCSWGRRP